MPKINKDTLVFIPSEKIKVYKHINGTNYYCSFYCGKAHTSSGIKEICLKETNILKAKVLALKYKQFEELLECLKLFIIKMII